MSKIHHWTTVDAKPPKEGRLYWCYAGDAALGAPQFMAMWHNNNWYGNHGGSWTRLEPDVSHYRDCYEGPSS